MTDQEIREAIKIIEALLWNHKSAEGAKEVTQALQTLLSLAEQYLAVQAKMPRRKICPLCNGTGKTKGTYVDNANCEAVSEIHSNTEHYNQALHEATLAVMKMCSVEKLAFLLYQVDSVAPNCEETLYDWNTLKSIRERYTKKAQAIHKAIVGGEK